MNKLYVIIEIIELTDLLHKSFSMQQVPIQPPKLNLLPEQDDETAQPLTIEPKPNLPVVYDLPKKK